MEAFEQLVKVYLESQNYVVTTNVKLPVHIQVCRRGHILFQECHYEMDIVAAKHDSLILGSVKSFLGSQGVRRDGFKETEHPEEEKNPSELKSYAIFNFPDRRQQVFRCASERYGYPLDHIRLVLYAGRFQNGKEDDIREHLKAIHVGAGSVEVVDIQTIVRGLLDASASDTYCNDPVIMTIKALNECGVNVIGPRLHALRTRAHVTRPELATRLEAQGLNVDQAMISRIEKGERPVLDYELVAIAKALKISSVELLSDDD